MNEQTSVKELLHQIANLTTIYHFALSGKGNPSMMMSYLNRKGVSYILSPEDKSIEPWVCLLFKETIANELDYLYSQAKTAARQEIDSLDCVPSS